MRRSEAGSSLAAVIGVVAVTGIVVLTLLTTTVFGAGFSSASRAGVQAQAAAEGGIDYARANLAACDPLTRTVRSPTDISVPEFVVAVEYRMAPYGNEWRNDTCPPRAATSIRLRSTGFAQTDGVAGHSRGDERTMEAVLVPEFPFAVLGQRAITFNGGLTVATEPPAMMSTSGALGCSGTLHFTGPLYVGGSAGCGTPSQIIKPPAFDPTAPPHVLEDFVPGAARWPQATFTTLPNGSCDPPSTATIVLTRRSVNCGASLVLDGGVVLELQGDVVIFAADIKINDAVVRAPDGGRHTLYLVKPSTRAAEKALCAPNVETAGVVEVRKIKTLDNSRVMLASSTRVNLNPPLQQVEGFVGQAYGCVVDASGSAKITYAPAGPLVLHSKRDVVP